MIEVQTRNFISGTGLLQSKPEVKKERKSIPNKSKLLQDNHTSHLIQLKEELLTLKSICIGMNVDIRISNHPTLRLIQFQLGRISFQLLLLWIRMERINRIENRQVRNFRLSTDRQGITWKVYNHILLNMNGLQDCTVLKEPQQKRSQTELASYETMNVDSVPPSTQGQHAFTQS
ncbi:MAG: hypothetical protein EZS28_055291, partial [Streblomastix strix]